MNKPALGQKSKVTCHKRPIRVWPWKFTRTPDRNYDKRGYKVNV